MTTPVYEITVKQFIDSLGNLKNILNKTQSWADSKKINESVVLGLRLAPDMFPLIKQIQIVCDNAKGTCSRLTGQSAPVFEDKEVTLSELMTRIDNTISYLKTIKPEMFAGYEKHQIEFFWNPGQILSGENYLIQYALPNFYFHMTTAYAILRSNGLEIGKGDFLGNLKFTPKNG